MWVKAGMKSDGSITALHFRNFLDGGAYGSYGVASTFYTGALQTVTYPIANYKFIPYAIVLEAMLILISVHGFNGLRVILLEVKQGRVYENAVTYGCLAAMIILIAYGSRTIIMASMGMV